MKTLQRPVPMIDRMHEPCPLSQPAAPLTAREIAALEPVRTPAASAPEALARLREPLQHTGQWHGGQMAGRRWPVACVSLEITQRCNLDCTLCYLSESAERVRDFPLDEIFRRIDMIHAHYGAGIDVQVSGGEPTLRARDELVAIVRRIADRGLRPSLLTNGIRATRSLLHELSAVGLCDVAFHVDTTQQRRGYGSEVSLNVLRRDYIERARGLPIGVFFNTSVHAGNLDDVPMITAFFAAHADVVGFASFQLQADTGRGVLRERDGGITQAAIEARLQRGVGTALHFGTLAAGHHACNRSAVVMVAREPRARRPRVHAGPFTAWDAFADEPFVRRFMRETADVVIDRRTRKRAAASIVAAALRRPRLAIDSARWLARMLIEHRAAIARARGRVHKLTLFTHNFMDACGLDRDRIDACVFMAMTQHGPLSMCAFNAKRDVYLLEPLNTAQGEWQPMRAAAESPIRFLKGRERDAWLQAREAGRGVRDISDDRADGGAHHAAVVPARAANHAHRPSP